MADPDRRVSERNAPAKQEKIDTTGSAMPSKQVKDPSVFQYKYTPSAAQPAQVGQQLAIGAGGRGPARLLQSDDSCLYQSCDGEGGPSPAFLALKAQADEKLQ